MSPYKVRARFIVALFLTFMVIPVGNQLIAQSISQTIPINITTLATTQLLAGAGRTNQVNVVMLAMGQTQGAGVSTSGSIQFATGTVDGESTPCTTGRTLLTGALTFASGNTGGLFPEVWGNPVMVIPASSAYCAITTNAASFQGWATVVK